MTVPLRRSPEAVVRPGAEAPFRVVKPPCGDSGPLVGEAFRLPRRGVARCQPSEQLVSQQALWADDRTDPVGTEAPPGCQSGLSAFPAGSPRPRPLRTWRPPFGCLRAFEPAEAGLSAPPARTEAPAEGAQRYDALLAASNQIAS